MKYDPLHERLHKLVRDEGPDLTQVNVALKCRTSDGMIYTLDVIEFTRSQYGKEVPFEDVIFSRSLDEVLHLTELISRDPNRLQLSSHECVSIKSSEIVRIWADIDATYVTGMLIE